MEDISPEHIAEIPTEVSQPVEEYDEDAPTQDKDPAEDDKPHETFRRSKTQPTLANTERILEKNKMLRQLLDEMKVSESQRLEMQKQITNLSQKLVESTALIDKTNLEYSQLTKSLREAESHIQSLQNEKESLLLRVDSFASQTQSRISNEDEIIAAVNQRVEEWKALFLAKETTILQLQNEITKLKTSLDVSSSTNSKTTIAVLSKAVREKDAEINRLKSELLQATKELEGSALIIENFNSAEKSSKDNDWQKKQINNLRKKLSAVETRENELRIKFEEAETSGAKSEKALAEALARLKLYEANEYGLADAVQEIKDCRFQLEIRDHQIEELTLVTGQLEVGLMDLQEENEELKVKLGLEVEKQDLEEILKKIKMKNNEYTKKSLPKSHNLPKFPSEVSKKDAHTTIFLKEMTDQVQQLHSEFEELIKTTRTLRTSSALSDSVNEPVIAKNVPIPVVQAATKTVSVMHAGDLQTSIKSELNEKLHSYEEEIKNNAENMTKLEKKLADASKTIEELESKLMNEKQEFQSPASKLDAHLAFQLKELSQAPPDKVPQVNNEQLKDESIKLKQQSELLALDKVEFEALKEQHQHLLTTLEKSEDSVKMELAEMGRRLTVSSVNERKLFKKCSYLMEEVNFHKKQHSNLQNEVLAQSNATICRLGYLEGFKQTACYKIASLHRALEGTTSSAEMEAMERKLKECMDRQTLLIEENEHLLSLLNNSSTFSKSVASVRENEQQINAVDFELEVKDLQSQLDSCKDENMNLTNDIAQLKISNEVALNQVKSLQLLNVSKSMELDTVKLQMMDNRGENDERDLIKKLYLQILSLQLSENNLQNKLQTFQAQIQKIEMFSLRLEQRCDEKDQLFQRHHWQAHIKMKRLRKIIRQLQSEHNQKRSEMVIENLALREDRIKVDNCLKEVREEEHRLNLLKTELDTKNSALMELLIMKNDNNIAESVDKHYKIAELRIQSNKHSCQLEWLTRELERKDTLLKKYQNRVAVLDDELARLTAEQWERELALDGHDLQLERTLQRSEAAVAVNEVSGSKDPESDQRLQDSLKEIKEKSFILSEKQEEIKTLTKREKDILRRAEELEILLSARDQVIEELRSNMSGVMVSREKSEDMPRVTRAVVDGLKARLAQKEETISKYEALMENVKKEMMKLVENQKTELKNAKSYPVNVEVVKNLENVKTIDNSMQQIGKINELQEITVQQDNAIIILAEKLKASSKEIQKWQLKVENIEKEFEKEKDKIIEEYEANIKKLENEIELSVLRSKNLNEELDLTKEKLDEQIIVNKSSPSTIMKTTIDDLKLQLKSKDREAESLSRVVANLNSKMKVLVEDKAVRPSQEQLQVQGPTKELELLRIELGTLKRKLKAQEQPLLHLKEVEEKLDRQTAWCSKLQAEKQRCQQIIQSLEAKVKILDGKTKEVLKKPTQEEHELKNKQSREMIDKLNLELGRLSKQNAQLRQQVDKLKTEVPQSTVAKKPKSKSEVDTPEVKSSAANSDVNSKIQFLINEIDKLTDTVKNITATPSLEQNNVLLEEVESLRQLRNDVAKLHRDKMLLKSENEHPKTSEDLTRLREAVLDQPLVVTDAVTSKMVEHNERLLKDYQREMKTNERQRIQLHILKSENEMLQKQVDQYYKILHKRQQPR